MRRAFGFLCAPWLAAVGVLLIPANTLADHSVTELVSVPSNGSNPAVLMGFAGASPNGDHFALLTAERLDPADTDAKDDIYVRSFLTDTTTLASVGPTGGNGPFDVLAFPLKVGNDGRVIFETAEILVPEDTDTKVDLYARVGNTTTLLSNGPAGGNGAYDVAYVDSTPDATHVLFQTNEKLTADDTSPGSDLYVRDGGTTTLISTGPTGAGCGCNGRISVSGDRVVFTTATVLTADDADATGDIYAREGNTTTLLSTGPYDGYRAPYSANLQGASDDLSVVQFDSGDSLVAEDADNGGWDTYVNSAGTTTLLSTGPAVQAAFGLGVAEDGSRSWFKTEDALTSDDTDSYPDIYQRRGDVTTLISRNTPIYRSFSFFVTGGEPGFIGASANGERVFFKTENNVTPSDTDPNRCYVEEDGDYYRKRCEDVFMYEAATNSISHVSTGPGGGGAYDVEYGSQVSDDGMRLFFLTAEPLLGQDMPTCGAEYLEDPGCIDVYERTLGAVPDTHLLSKGPQGGFGPYNASRDRPVGAKIGIGLGASVDGRRYYFVTREQLTSADTDTEYDIYVSAVAEEGGYPRPKAARDLQVSLVPAATACTAPNRTHGPPLAFGSCSPPVPESQTLTIGAGGTSPFYANSSGLVRLDVLPGAPGGADDTDVAVRVNVTSVWRQTGTRVDYDGELEARIGLRNTDKDGTVPSTIEDRSLSVNVPCTTTPDDAVGSTCAVVTTADAISPGMVPERTRAVWELGQVRVFDGGPDGDADTAGDNSLFMTQGLFAP